jgi:hypothetical protein
MNVPYFIIGFVVFNASLLFIVYASYEANNNLQKIIDKLLDSITAVESNSKRSVMNRKLNRSY